MMHRTAVAALAMAILSAPAAAQQDAGWRPDHSPSQLTTGTYEYTVTTANGAQHFTKTLEQVAEGEADYRYSTAMNMGGMDIVQSTTFTDQFRPVASHVTGPSVSAELHYGGDRVTGQVSLPTGVNQVDAAITPDAVGTGMDALAIALTDLSERESFTFRMSDGGDLHEITVTVEGEEEVTVPAGTFDAYRLTASTAAGDTQIWVTRDAPHLLLRQSVQGGAATIELQNIRRDGGT